MTPKKNLEAKKPKIISTETSDSLIYKEKLFLSQEQKVRYMLLSNKKWVTKEEECEIDEFKKLESKYIYEYFPEGDMIFVVDVDRKVSPEEIYEGMEEETLSKALKKLEEDLKVNRDECGISSYHRVTGENYKISYHITIPKIKTDKESLKEYCKKNSEIFDESFTSRGFLRGPLSKKPFEMNGRPKIEQGSIDDFVLCDLSRCEREFRYKRNVDVIDEKKSELPENSKKIEKYRTILSGLNDSRADEYEDWIKVGMILKNELGESGYDLWYDFSKRSKKFKGHIETSKKWESFNESKEVKLGEGSLIMLLKDDNIDLYKKVININITLKSEIEWERLTHATFGEKLAEINKDKFIYSEGKLYYWTGYYWKEDDARYITLKSKFRDLYNYYNYNLSVFNLDCKKPELIKHYKQKILQLENNNYEKQVIEKSFEYFKKDNIKWNQKPEILQFENGCYNIEEGKFVDPDPLNYISFSIGYDYKKGDELVKNELVKIIKSIVKDDENYNSLMKYIASCLYHGNREEHAEFWTNTGRNGKGLMKDLTKMAFGNYQGELISAYYTKISGDASNHTTHLVKIMNSRIIYTSETDENVEFKEEPFKKCTGGDDIIARDLFKDSKETLNFKMGKVIILTNNLPKFTKVDKGIRDRIIIRKFPYTFVNKDDYEKSNPNLKIKDEKLKQKLSDEKYRYAFLDLLFEYYKIYKKEGYTKTIEMKEDTDKYLRSMDTVGSYLNEILKYVGNEKNLKESQKRIAVKDLYNSYSLDIDKRMTIEIFTKRIQDNGKYTLFKYANKNYIKDYILKEETED